MMKVLIKRNQDFRVEIAGFLNYSVNFLLLVPNFNYSYDEQHEVNSCIDAPDDGYCNDECGRPQSLQGR